MNPHGLALASLEAELTLDQAEVWHRLERKRTVLDAVPAVIAYWDAELRNVLANRAHEDYIGRTPEEMRGARAADLLPAAELERILPHLEEALAGRRVEAPGTLHDARGRLRHVHSTYVPEVVDGRARGVVVHMSDVTDLVEVEHALEEAQELARLGTWRWRGGDAHGEWSPQLFDILGLDPDHHAPSIRTFLRAIHPDDRPLVERVWEHGRTTGEPWEVRCRLRRPDGEVVHVATRGRARLAPGGAVVDAQGTVLDETAQQRAHEDLAAANALLSDTMAMLAHDVRQPLALMLGYLQLASQAAGTDDVELTTYLERGLRGAQKLGRLVDDVLAMSRADAGTLTADPEDLDLEATVGELLDELAVPVERHHGDAPRVRCDRFHLRQALANLVANAQKHGRAPLRVRTWIDGDRGVVRVADSGDGVAAADVAGLFERFVQGHGATRGSGFGLYLVRRLIEVNEGTVRYVDATASPDGPGFEIRLPLAAH